MSRFPPKYSPSSSFPPSSGRKSNISLPILSQKITPEGCPFSCFSSFSAFLSDLNRMKFAKKLSAELVLLSQDTTTSAWKSRNQNAATNSTPRPKTTQPSRKKINFLKTRWSLLTKTSLSSFSDSSFLFFWLSSLKKRSKNYWKSNLGKSWNLKTLKYTFENTQINEKKNEFYWHRTKTIMSIKLALSKNDLFLETVVVAIAFWCFLNGFLGISWTQVKSLWDQSKSLSSLSSRIVQNIKQVFVTSTENVSLSWGKDLIIIAKIQWSSVNWKSFFFQTFESLILSNAPLSVRWKCWKLSLEGILRSSESRNISSRLRPR